MPSAMPVSLAARERLRDHQASAAKAVAAHGAAVARLDATSARRNEIVAAQDALVAAAAANVAAAVAEVARVLGADVAAAVLELPKSEVRRMSKESE
jgi:hypothetical protein